MEEKSIITLTQGRHVGSQRLRLDREIPPIPTDGQRRRGHRGLHRRMRNSRFAPQGRFLPNRSPLPNLT